MSELLPASGVLKADAANDEDCALDDQLAVVLALRGVFLLVVL